MTDISVSADVRFSMPKIRCERGFRAGPPFCVSMEVRSIERQARVTCQGTKENRPEKTAPPAQQPPQEEVVVRLPLTDLYPFPDHPFQVRDDEEMRETIQSVKEYGVIVPAIVRPREEGGYEIVAGHRRKYACEQAGLDTMPVLIRNLDRDAATIIMVDSNFQRENIRR